MRDWIFRLIEKMFVKTLTFPDHYNYSNADIIKIKETAKNLKTKIINRYDYLQKKFA